MVKLKDPKVVMPTGNEGGANSLWRPGGLTDPGGKREAILDNIEINHNNDINKMMTDFGAERIQ
ncbi:MAG: hypothetical protein EOO68_02955 [Moraxellaceae bacterium]|nr:MAG: hypothetical protein EOO68_02955 [Moraxellaceae bacterium]